MAIQRYKTFVDGAALPAADLNGIEDMLVNAATGEDSGVVTGTAGSNNELVAWNSDGDAVGSGIILGEAYQVACSDETTALSVATGVLKFRMPYAATLSSIRASLGTASSSGLVTVDVNMNGVSVFSTTLTIDANEKTSTTAATPAVLGTTALTDDAEITVDIDGAGTNAAGLKLTFYWKRSA